MRYFEGVLWGNFPGSFWSCVCSHGLLHWALSLQCMLSVQKTSLWYCEKFSMSVFPTGRISRAWFDKDVWFKNLHFGVYIYVPYVMSKWIVKSWKLHENSLISWTLQQYRTHSHCSNFSIKALYLNAFFLTIWKMYLSLIILPINVNHHQLSLS